MKYEKLPSGSYRIRKTYNKKVYTVIFDHKPTDLEVMKELSKKVDRVISDTNLPFEIAAAEYAKLKKNVISPTTYREYVNTSKRLSDRFNSLLINDITQMDIQQEINDLSAKLGAKTVCNYHGFIVSVIHLYRPDMFIHTTLPKKAKKQTHIPTDDDVKKLFQYAKENCNGRYYIPIVLACYGLRRSEICALRPEDIKDNVAYISKTKVFTSDKEWVIRDMTKTETSTRSIPIPESVVKLINEQGFVFDGHPNSISDFINDACNRLKIEHFSVHKLRHYFCSRLASENIDTETIMLLGGWKSDYVLRQTYRHAVTDKVKEATNKLNTIISV